MTKRRLLIIMLVVPIFLLTTLLGSAQISDSQYQKIDSLFVAWNQPNHPGGAVGIVKNGKTVFSKAYGLASLEYLVPNSPSTIFNIASVSKQFTAMGIVILQQEGKLDFDDDIRKYLPELPDFGETITIRHMLHHTSGLRSLHALLGLAGWRSDDSRTNEDLNRFMLKQRDLNFKPGDEYMYCNTGYMLMVNIIEKITGEKFPKWMKETVFEPLGMIHTYVEDNYSSVVLNNATSYNSLADNKFDRAVEYWGYIGSGNMHSTTDDLLRWLENFRAPQAGWDAHFGIMQTLDKLNNGAENNYAFGLSIGKGSDGTISIGHGGSIGGFRSHILTCPEEELSIVILANFSNGSPAQMLNMIAGIVIESEDNQEIISQEPVRTLTLSNKVLSKYEGSYWNIKSNYSRKIYLRDDTLRYFRSENSENALIPIGKDEFRMFGVSGNIILKFDMSEREPMMSFLVDGSSPILHKGFTPIDPNKEELAAYAGRFYSPELETAYVISFVDDTLICHHSRHGDFEMQRIKKDILQSEWPVSITKFQRDEEGEITGILVSNERAINVWFEKQ